MKRRHVHNQRGFTLIELSMVAVIIALLAVAVTTGKGLLEASRIRSLITELIDLNETFLLFREKYNDIPGDMSDAWDYWGSNCMPTADLCNGNGDERIGNTLLPTDNYETGTAWRHLQLAEMLGGNMLDGTASIVGTGFIDEVIGVNLPPSDVIIGAGYHVFTYNVFVESGPLVGTPILLGTHILLASFGDVFATPVLAPRQASVIDNKLDDGIPRVGKIKGNPIGIINGQEDSCYKPWSTTTSLRESEYYIETNATNCVIYYRLDTSRGDTVHQ